MYCQECGAQNPDNSVQCIRCGAQIIDNSRSGNPKPKKTFDLKKLFKDMKSNGNKNTIIIFGCVAAFIVFILIFVGIGKSSTNPRKIAQKYFASYATGNYAQMYTYLNVRDSAYITPDAFIAFMNTQDNPLKNVTNFTVDDQASALESAMTFTRCFRIKYVTSEDQYEHEYLITMTKAEGKSLFFFDRYCVTDSSIPLATNIVVYAPANASVSMDGIPLENPKKPAETGNTLNEYDIPEAIGGKHFFTVTGPTYFDYTEEQTLESGKSYTLSAPLNDAALQNLKVSGDGVIRAFFIGSVVRKSFDELGLNENLRSAYAEQSQSFDSSFAKGVEISSIEYQDPSTTKDGTIKAKVSYRFSFENNGKLRQNDESRNITLGFYFDEASNLNIKTLEGRM